MALTIRNAMITPTPSWHTRKGDKKILASEQYMLSMHLKKDGKDMFVAVTFRQSFTINGLSVPPKLRWFLPNWKEDDQLYNTAGAVHDWLYATKGNYGMFTRSECDDIFRGILRESGISRFKAGVADKAVEWFAGGKNHWGNDDYKIADKCSMVVRYL